MARSLVEDFRRGYLTRRGFLAKAAALGLTAAGAGLLAVPTVQRSAGAQGSTGPAPTRSTCTCSCARVPTSSSTRTNQEGLAKDEVYKFAYVLGVNKIEGTAARKVLRLIGLA